MMQSFLLLVFISEKRTLTETDGWAPFPCLIIDGIMVRGCASAAMSVGPWLPPPLCGSSTTLYIYLRTPPEMRTMGNAPSR
jgi:hypothetical protein